MNSSRYKEYEEKIIELDKLIEQGYQDCQERRMQWEEAVSSILIPTLEKIASLMKLTMGRRGIYVQKHEVCGNFETVQFWFGQTTTGLSYKEQTADGRLYCSTGVEEGAALVFSLGEDGRVLTLLYPFQSKLPEIPDQKKTKETKRVWIGKIFKTPKDITADEVYRIVISFIEFSQQFSIFSPTESEKYPKQVNKEWREIVDGVVEDSCKEPKKILGFIPEVINKSNKS